MVESPRTTKICYSSSTIARLSCGNEAWKRADDDRPRIPTANSYRGFHLPCPFCTPQESGQVSEPSIPARLRNRSTRAFPRLEGSYRTPPNSCLTRADSGGDRFMRAGTRSNATAGGAQQHLSCRTSPTQARRDARGRSQCRALRFTKSAATMTSRREVAASSVIAEPDVRRSSPPTMLRAAPLWAMAPSMDAGAPN